MSISGAVVSGWANSHPKWRNNGKGKKESLEMVDKGVLGIFYGDHSRRFTWMVLGILPRFLGSGKILCSLGGQVISGMFFLWCVLGFLGWGSEILTIKGDSDAEKLNNRFLRVLNRIGMLLLLASSTALPLKKQLFFLYI